ncbi:hypothetical protein BS78_03G301700 [Paspalum vaginatum]|nr:hypothetical protein BS78_03G301700 [Paspalum vaginatum]
MANYSAAALVIACLLVAAALADASPPALICHKVYGAEARDVHFLRFNPNINCHNLFFGQWVCIAAVRA